MDARLRDAVGGGPLPGAPAWQGSTPAIRQPYRVEIRTGAEMEEPVKAWRYLALRAVEPSIFAEPEVVLPGIKHLPEGRRAVFLLVWQGSMLRGVFPVTPPRVSLRRSRLVLWRASAAAPGIPLIDRDAPEAVLEAALAFIAKRRRRLAGLVVPNLPSRGALERVIQMVAQRTGRPLTLLGSREGIVLADQWRAVDVGADGHGRAEMEDLWHKRQALAERGPVRVDHARDPREVRDAVEEFLVLEASSRTLGRGGATLQDPGHASFLRVVSRTLSRARHAQVDVLRVGANPVAAAVVLIDATRAWVWKVAEADAFAALSPGAQLLVEIARGRLERPRLDLAASLADETVEGLWPTRAVFAEHLIAIEPGDNEPPVRERR